jgi:ubiquinone/menaquinone biosynthesis C-methylase UbiE
MAKSYPFPRYDHPVLAWEYDKRQPLPFPGELEWHLKYIAWSGQPVIELACGSGRLLISVAKAGYAVDGMDRSATMLDRLREKLAECDEATRKRVRLFRADMMEFVPDRRYQTVFLAYNSLQYFERKDKVGAFFRRVPLFLQPQGKFLFVVRRLSLSDFQDGERVIYDSMKSPFKDEPKGLSVGSRFVSHLDAANGQLVNERTYVIAYRNGETERIVQITRAPIIETTEYIAMLKDGGMTATVYSGYDESPDDGMSRELCFVCRRVG